MKSKLYVLLTLLAMLDGGQKTNAQLTNSVYGFYWTAYPGAGCFATNVNGFENLAYLQWNPAYADQIIACNSKLIVDTTWVFWSGVNGSGLIPNYQASWNAYKAQFSSYYISQIAAFLVMDEPYLAAHGLTPAQLQTAVACIKADFPNIPVAVTFDAPSVGNFNSSSWIPSNLDWISFDQYGNFGAIAGLLSKIETYKQPNQKIFLTPQGWLNTGQAGAATDATVAGWSYDYHDLYLSDPEIFGQLTFLCRGSREFVFPSDGAMPLTYAVQQTIGTEVLKMGNSFKRAFSDMFESAPLWTANWTSVGAWARATTQVRAGSYSAMISGPVTDSTLTSQAIGVSNATTASVNFWWYIQGLTSGEYVRCDIALDNGAWTQVASIDGGGSSGSQWLHVIASDINVSGATNLYLRFRGTMSSSKYGFVDSVNVCEWGKATVTTWPTATRIASGQTLAFSTLSDGVATPGGSFNWAVPLTVPPLGTTTQSVIYTPSDTGNYNRTRGSVSITVTNAPNLIANGDFKANAVGFISSPGALGAPNPLTITSWTAGAGVIGVNGPATSAGSAYAPLNGDGGYTFAFSSWGGPSSSLSQTLSVDYTPGSQYELSFDAAQFRWGPSTAFRVQITDNSQTHFTTQVGGVDLDSTPLTSFTHFDYVFTAPATFNGPGVITLLNLDAVTASGGVDFANVSLHLPNSPGVFTVTTSLTPSAYGNSVTFTATVTGAGPTPTGTITFKDGAISLGSTTLSSGVATVTTTNLSATGSPHTITAVYGGDSNFSGSLNTLAGGQTVNPRALTVTGATVTSKPYDGTTSATITGATLSGVMGGDTVTLGAATSGTFSTKNAGTGLSVATAPMTISGPAAGNYTLTQPTLTGTITALPVTLSGSKTYDGTTTMPAAGVTMGNNLDGANLTLSGTATLAGVGVGAQALTTTYATSTRVQSVTGSSGSSAAITIPVTVTTPATGNTMVAVISTRGTSSGRVSSISQTGATWTRAAQAANANGTTTEIWYAPGVTGAGTSVTINLGSSLFASAVVAEYSGVLTVSSVDKTASNTGSGSAADTGTTATTTQANELWIGGIGLANSGYALGTPNNSFASVNSVASTSASPSQNSKVAALEKIVSATGAANSGGTVSGTAAIAQRGSATSANGTTTVSPGLPAGLAQGDLMIACVVAASTTTPTTLSGWTSISSSSSTGTSLGGTSGKRVKIMYKVAGASESAPSFACGSSTASFATLVAFSGVDNTTPMDATPATAPSVSTGSQTALPSVTSISTVTTNAAVVLFGMGLTTASGGGGTWNNGSWTTATAGALTELFDMQGSGTGTTATSIGAAWLTKVTAGATGAGGGALSVGMYNGGLLVALRPASQQWSGTIATFKTPVTGLTGLTLGGAAAGNYTLAGANGSVAISQAPLSVTANSDSKTYGQTRSYGSGSSAFSSLGLQNGETIGSVTLVSSGSGATAAVAGSPYTITPSAATGGTFNAANYSLAYNAGTLTVNRADLSVTANSDSKTYGQTRSYESGSSAFSSLGLQNGETIGSVTLVGSGGGASAAVAGSPYTITPSAATGGTFNPDNYNLAYHTGTLTVNRATLDVTSTGTLVYGQNPTNAIYVPTYVPLVASDTTSVISGAANFSTDATATSPVGTNYSAHMVDLGTLSADNYSFAAGPDGVLTVTPASLTVTNLLALDRPYDGGTVTTLDASGAGLEGLVNGDNVTLNSSSAAGAFADPNVGSGKLVTVSGLTLNGDLGTNYMLIQPSGLTASITMADPNVTAWPTATAITYGQTLADSRLSGGAATAAGSFGWTTQTTVPNAGTTAQSVTFTPDVPANYNSASDGVSVTVNPAGSTTALVSSQNPSTNGVSVRFTATVSSGAGTPTGNVLFLTNGLPLATVALAGGSASISTADLPIGTTPVEAQYAAQANWGASSHSLDQVVYSAVTLSTTNFILSIVGNGGGSYTLNLQGTPGAKYYVVASGDVSSPAWTALTGSTNTVPESGLWSFLVSNAAPTFYRVVAIDPAP